MATKGCIQFKDLEKEFGDKADSVYRDICQAGGFGIQSHHPDLAYLGAPDETKKAIDAVLSAAKKGGK